MNNDNEKHSNNKNSDKIGVKKTLTQQIFLNRMSESRCRTQSLGDTPTTFETKDNELSKPKENPWIEVTGKKRPNSSPEHNAIHKQTKLDAYWLSQPQPIQVTNSFASLDNEGSQLDKVTSIEKSSKPPPIFVDKVSNIQPLQKLLNDYATDLYVLKVLHNDQVKIQPKTADTYRIIVKMLEEKKTQFFTYKPKHERAFKVVLKKMHPSTDPEEIKEALNDLGHTCTNIWNIKQRNTKKPLPMFIVELLPNDNNKRIYDVKSLLHCIVHFEPPRPKREVPQCAKCQQYGHTKAYCHRQPRCIKCAGEHLSIDCPRKTRSEQVKCALCDGNHPANYKGCKIYRELQNLKFPKPRERLNQSIKRTALTDKPKSTIEAKNPQNPLNHTYKEVLANEYLPAVNEKSNDMIEIINLIKQMMQQLTTLTNLILAITTKTSK